MAETSNFRPKMAVSAENHIFGRKFSYGRNFGYGRISAFFKLFLTVTVFRKKFSFGHTLDLWLLRIMALSLFSASFLAMAASNAARGSSMITADRKSQVRQCLGSCTADVLVLVEI